MKNILPFIFSILPFVSLNSQDRSNPDYLDINALARLKHVQRSIDSILNPKSPETLDPKSLEGILTRTFPKSSTLDGRWVFHVEKANIQNIVKAEVRNIIPEYKFYRTKLTNYLGYHVNSSSNLILFDSLKSKIIHVVPMWYGDISKDFLQLFIGKHFSDSTSLLKFTMELKDLLNVGSTGNFENPKYAPDKVTFDLTYQGANRKEIWRHIEILITNNTIRAFCSTNPKMNTQVIVQ
jgi:hypothetical protein